MFPGWGLSFPFLFGLETGGWLADWLAAFGYSTTTLQGNAIIWIVTCVTGRVVLSRPSHHNLIHGPGHEHCLPTGGALNGTYRIRTVCSRAGHLYEAVKLQD